MPVSCDTVTFLRFLGAAEAGRLPCRAIVTTSMVPTSSKSGTVCGPQYLLTPPKYKSPQGISFGETPLHMEEVASAKTGARDGALTGPDRPKNAADSGYFHPSYCGP